MARKGTTLGVWLVLALFSFTISGCVSTPRHTPCYGQLPCYGIGARLWDQPESSSWVSWERVNPSLRPSEVTDVMEDAYADSEGYAQINVPRGRWNETNQILEQEWVQQTGNASRPSPSEFIIAHRVSDTDSVRYFRVSTWISSSA